jgi:capsular polysaccharide biosynthesis protein
METRSSYPHGPVAAGDVYRALWRHKVFIALMTAACVAVTWFVTSRETPSYQASTLVRVQQRTSSSSDTLAALQGSELLAHTYAEIIDSGGLDGQVRSLAARKIPAGESFGVDLSTSRPQDLGLIWISARNRVPERAAIVANAVPEALRGFIRRSGAQRDEIVTVKPAAVPSSAVFPHTSLNVALAAVLALIFNSALALLIEVFRDRLPEPDELAQAVGYPVLAAVPTLRLRTVTAVENDSEEVDLFESEAHGSTRARGGLRFADEADEEQSPR